MTQSTEELQLKTDECEAIAVRLRDEVRSISRIWTLVEAFNGRQELDMSPLRERLDHLGLTVTANALLKALARDTLMALGRITDQPKSGRQTFCRLSQLFQDEQVALHFENAARDWHTDWEGHDPEQDARCVREQIAFVRSLVPSGWTSNQSEPPDCRFLHLRERLRPLRDELLAHALTRTEDDQLTFQEIRDFVRLAIELEEAGRLAVLGKSEDLQHRWNSHLKQATDFWQLMIKSSSGEQRQSLP